MRDIIVGSGEKTRATVLFALRRNAAHGAAMGAHAAPAAVKRGRLSRFQATDVRPAPLSID